MTGHRGVRSFHWAGSVLVALAGCAADPAAEACGGSQPALEDCGAIGVYSADCGGDGTPTFACDPTLGTCRWFSGACVAQGYVASDCPASDPCCHPSGEGTWAFADGMTEDPATTLRELWIDIAVIADTPIDPSGSLNLDVAVDPTFTPPAYPTVTCEGEAASRTFAQLCQGYLLPMQVYRGQDTVALELTPNLYGATILFELIDDAGDGPTGRVYVGYQNDFRFMPVAQCGAAFPDLGFAPSGSLVVNGLGLSAMHGRITIPFDDGSITVAF